MVLLNISNLIDNGTLNLSAITIQLQLQLLLIKDQILVCILHVLHNIKMYFLHKRLYFKLKINVQI